MNSELYAQYFSAVFLVLTGLYGALRSFREYKVHDTPVKSFARTLLVSFVFFGIGGGLGVLLTITVSLRFWAFEAISVMVGYLLLADASLELLERLERYRKKEKKTSRGGRRIPQLPPAGMVSSKKDAKALLKAISSYFKVPILAIGREHPDKWMKEMGVTPVEYVWLTRVEHPNAINPSSLHILNGKITNFLARNPGGVVYMEGVEYVQFYVDERALIKFILSVRDTAIVQNGHFIMHVTPDVLSPSQMAIFKRELEPINVENLLERVSGTALFGALPPAAARKKEGDNNAGTGGAEGEGRANKEEAQKARHLRREEEAEEGG